MATADQLASIQAAIARREAGDAYDGYAEGPDSFTGTPLAVLYQREAQLLSRLAAEGGGSFQAFQKVRDRR